MSAAGVTSKAGLKTAMPSGAVWRPATPRTSRGIALLDGDGGAGGDARDRSSRRARRCRTECRDAGRGRPGRRCRSCWRCPRWRRSGRRRSPRDRPPPRFITDAAATSEMSRWGMPSRTSSHAVRREPCITGRVSSTHTSASLPRSCAARMTPSAVPYPAVASAPALQWVRTRPPSGTSAAPWAPMARLAATSSSRIAWASSSSRPRSASIGTVRFSIATRAHPLERPEEVHRGRPRGAQALDRLLEIRQEAFPPIRATLARRQHDAERGGDADRGRAAHDERADRLGHLLPGRAVPFGLLDRQPGLVEQGEP